MIAGDTESDGRAPFCSYRTKAEGEREMVKKIWQKVSCVEKKSKLLLWLQLITSHLKATPSSAHWVSPLSWAALVLPEAIVTLKVSA